METRANYALIGLFTLAVLAAGFGFVLWFSGKDAGTKLNQYRVVFNGSVSGLSRGSSVLYNGLRVGEVVSIQLMPEDPSKVVARVDVDASTPVNVDTRARLEFQGLTGVASIQFSGGKPGSQPLTSSNGQPPVIVADRSDFQDLLESVQSLSRKADEVLGQASKLFADNSESINRTAKNIEQFSGALASNSDGVAKFLSSTGTAADRIAELSVDLRKLSDNVDQVVRAIKPEDVSQIVANVKDVTQAVAQDREQINAALRDAASLMSRLNESSGKLDGAIADASSALKSVNNALKDVDGAKVARTVDNLDRFSAALGDNAGRIDQVVKDAGEMAGKLNKASDRVDGVLASADSALKSANDALKGVDGAKVARTVDNLDRFSTALADNSARFDSVLKNADELSAKLNKASDRVDTVLADASGALKSVSNTLKDVDGAKVARTVENIDKFTTALGSNTGRIDQVFRDAAEISAKLNGTADKLDTLIESAQNVIGNSETQGTLNEISEAAKSVRRLADNLDKRTAEITAGLNKATGPALRDVESFASDGKRTLNEINRTLRSFQSNPQQLLFGSKPSIPEYSGTR
jgi:phospholipid/cholesterol/gamma-HCH transport system substrate-binding protein